MERLGLTVREVARAARCSETMVRATLRDGGTGSLSTVNRIARTLGVDAVTFLNATQRNGGRNV